MEIKLAGATAYTAGTTNQFLHAKNVQVMGPWPAKSPDLNPIEHVWSMIGSAVRNGPNPPRNQDEMAQALITKWNAIDNWTIQRLIYSMRRRCTAVIQANGGSTRY